jgi:hypothetical protein
MGQRSWLEARKASRCSRCSGSLGISFVRVLGRRMGGGSRLEARTAPRSSASLRFFGVSRVLGGRGSDGQRVTARSSDGVPELGRLADSGSKSLRSWRSEEALGLDVLRFFRFWGQKVLGRWKASETDGWRSQSTKAGKVLEGRKSLESRLEARTAFRSSRVLDSTESEGLRVERLEGSKAMV